MNRLKMVLLFSSVVSVSLSYGAPLFNCDQMPSITQAEVCKAHEALLSGKSEGLVDVVGAGLEKHSGNSLVSQNLLALLSDGYAMNSGTLDSKATLPQGVQFFKIRVKRRFNTGTQKIRYSTSMVGEPDHTGRITDLQLQNAQTGEVVLDKNRKIGEFEDTRDSDGLYFAIWTETKPDPIPEGMYQVTIGTDNREVQKGNVLLSQMAASSSPTVVSPVAGQVVTTSTPTIAFEDFISNEYTGSERRKLVVKVVDAETMDHELFVKTIEEPRKGAVKVDSLPNGNYVAQVSFREIRKQGPIRLERESATYVPFSIQR